MLNKVFLIGYLGDDPKITYTDDGRAVVNLSLATRETYKSKDSGEKIKKTEWHKLVCYGKGAETLEKYTKKGSRLYIEGSKHTNQWEDNNGDTKYSTEIKVKEFLFLNGSSKDNQETRSPQHDMNSDDDDLPF
ncbi:single-stranded DNA-binding protein [Aquimarina longa]|uniref:single-stranded DNA-binding protein n=1 Tax=Aquimarina longa TaxID=1080221 RepID=UPI000784D5A4|nr:single-stranded DNA-binding protein [Aquimarina longa]